MTDSLAERLQTMFSTAISFHQQGEGDKARQIYEQIIQLNPAHFEALHLLGLVAAQKGNYRLAVEWMDKAIAIDSGNPGFHSNRGLALYELGEMDAAVESFKKALAIDPYFAQAHNNQGLALQALSRLDDALASFDKAITLVEDYAEAHYNKGLVLHKLQRFEEAVECYGRALQRAPDYADAHYNKGLAQKALDRFNDAISSFRACLSITPDSAEAHFNLGVVLQKINLLAEAMASYDRAIAIDPDLAQAHNNRGFILKELKQWSESIASYDRAIEIEPTFFEAYCNRGIALQKLNQLQQAIDNFNKAIAIEPGYADAYLGRGFALQAMGAMDAAIGDYDQALQLNPDFAMAKLNKALVLLLKGDWTEGWALYESGSAAGKRAGVRKLLHEWGGEAIRGSLLVLPEQGVGDEIFYSGMLNDLKGFAALVTVGVDPRLMPLYRRSFDHLKVVSSKELPDMSSHDAQIHMASLGRYFRADADAFRRIRSPYLKADPERTQSLRQQVASDGKLVCGLSWVSKNKELGEYKSFELRDLKPILQLPGLTFVDLQYGDTAAERAALQESTGIEVRHIDEVDNFNDLDGLAALIEACDVVVTVSNTTAHLAGALGKKVMVMVPRSSGLFWYWHIDRSDSPWYPSAKLFRQTVVGEWNDVIEAVRDELQNACLK